MKMKMQKLAEDRRTAAEARKRDAEEKRKATLEVVEAKKRAAAEKRKAALDATEAKTREAAKKKASSEARKKEQAAEKRKLVLKAEAKKRQIAGNVSAQEAKRKEQATKVAVAAVEKAKPSATISLGFLNFGKSNDDKSDSPTIVSSAPRGVPTLSKWRQNRDGSITGLISGSNAYRNNESITTSPITSKAADNAVVQTTSGSKYMLLSNKASTVPMRAPAIKAAPKKAPVPKARKSVQAVEKANPGATISLGFLKFGSDDKVEQKLVAQSVAKIKAPPQIVSQAPRGVPTLSKWRQNRDSSVSGMISGSDAYREGETITTSPITGDAADGALVQTTSGSKYFLEPKAQFGGFFGGKTKDVVQTSKASASASDSLKNQAEKRKAAAEGRKREAEEQRKAALKAAEGRKREAEEKREAARTAAEGRKREAEEKRTAALAAAEAKKREITEKRQAAADARKVKMGKEKQSQALKAEGAVAESTPRATISLGFLNFGQPEDTSSAPPSTAAKGKTPPSKMAVAPRGVPTLYNWRQNRDKSITGFIAGSKSYSDGESVTTSPLASETAFGALVQTATGSKYYLAAKGTKPPKAPALAKPVNTRSTFSLGKAVSRPNPTAASAVRTFSLGKPQAATQRPPSKSKAKKPVPRGVPKLAKWRKNRDSTITGIISGSPSYDEGDRVTTSVIVSGTTESGEVVQTGSGSKYYLD